MIFYRLLKKLVFVTVLVVGLTACSQFGSSGPTTADANDQAITKTSGTHYAWQKKKHQYSLFSSAATDDANSIDPGFVGGGDFWQHLRSDFQLAPADDKPQVQAQINWFIHNRDYLDHTLRRSEPYMYYILQQVEKRNLPGELALIPVGESAYNPAATSPAGAAGMWQLMRVTAKDLGVKQTLWFDGRRDIYASTNAALDHMMYLQSYFGGDWLLAIAAYDSGEGTVQNAIRHNAVRGDASDFWALPVPAETRSYVPRLLALASIVRNPQKYGITLPTISDKPYLAQVDIGAPISLDRAAQLAGLNLTQIKQLNPGYSRMVTDPNGPYKLILPIDRIATFKEQLAAVPSLPKTTWGRYKVQRGDSLQRIADRYHTTVPELMETNHLRSRFAPVGKVIMIPTGTTNVTPRTDITPSDSNAVDQAQASAAMPGGAMASAEQTLASNSVTAIPQASDAGQAEDPTNALADDTSSSSQQHIHIVKRNESLSTIAANYHVRTSDILRWNKLKSSNGLKPGKKLIIYTGPARHSNSAHHSVNRSVKSSQTSHKSVAHQVAHNTHAGHSAQNKVSTHHTSTHTVAHSTKPQQYSKHHQQVASN